MAKNGTKILARLKKKVLEKTNEQEQIPVPHKKLKAGVGFSGFIVYPSDIKHQVFKIPQLFFYLTPVEIKNWLEKVFFFSDYTFVLSLSVSQSFYDFF